MPLITRFRDEYYFLSNFYPVDFTVDGIMYNSAEHAYQAATCLNPIDAERIRNAPTPAIARSMVAALLSNPIGREQQKFTQMLGILTLKFDKPRLMLALQNTRDRDIIHRNNWHDTYWGTCTCSEHNGSGSNMLGYLLTIIRSSNRSEF